MGAFGHWLFTLHPDVVLTVLGAFFAFLLWVWRQKRKVQKWLKSEVIEPLHLVKVMTSENGHMHDPPTLPDRMSVMEKRQDLTDQSVTALNRGISMLAEHLDKQDSNLAEWQRLHLESAAERDRKIAELSRRKFPFL